jgi:hypothetical protein
MSMGDSTGFRSGVAGAALTLTAALCAPAFAAAQPQAEVDDEVIVRGRSYGELRLQIRLRQDAVFARFNDINSDDAFDIHCTMEVRYESHIRERRCLSNSWRKQDSNIGQAFLGVLQDRSGMNPAFYRAEQLRMQGLLKEEMRRLAYEDAELGAAVLQLGQAMQALQIRAGGRPSWTMFREVQDGDDQLAFNAERIFEVQMGLAPWTHYLTYPTFTVDGVSGNVRKIQVDCEQGSRKVDYEPDVEWTVPRDWSRCILLVRAKRGSTFTFYEFQ